MNNLKRIIIIDDNKIDCFINQKIISLSLKYRVPKIFNSAIEALDYFENAEKDENSSIFLDIDFILLDINMPSMNGFEFLNKLAKLQMFIINPVDVFFLSSSICEPDISEALSNKFCTGYITKPLTREKINDIILSKNKIDMELMQKIKISIQ